jgi:hypothetical protein
LIPIHLYPPIYGQKAQNQAKDIIHVHIIYLEYSATPLYLEGESPLP